MKRFIVMGKYSQDFLMGLMYTPQDRVKASSAMMKKAGIEWAKGESYLHINHPDFDFMGIVYAKNDETMKASGDMMRASGNWDKFNFYRAWLPEEYTNISKEASELVGSYVPPSEYKEN